MEVDRRTSFRCSVQSYPDAALLRSAHGETIIRITEMSAGGFGLVADRTTHTHVGEMAELITNASRWQVKICHVNVKDDEYYVGVERVKELAKPGTSNGNDLTVVHDQKPAMSRLILFLVGIGSALLTWGAFFLTDSSSNGADSAKDVSARWQVPDDRDQREQLLVRSLQQLDELQSKNMAKTLGLRGGQRSQIEAIVEKTLHDMNAVHATMDAESPGSWSELGMMVVHRAWKEVDQILNDEQQSLWDEYLLGEKFRPVGVRPAS